MSEDMQLSSPAMLRALSLTRPATCKLRVACALLAALHTRVGTLIVATIYLQLIQNRYMFRRLLSFSVVTSIVYNPLPAMWKS